MKSIILAAGKGSRLGELTKEKPKILNFVNGKTILDYQLNVMRSCGIKDISIVTGYLNQFVKCRNIKKYINQNYDKTNMVSTLFAAKEEFEDSSDIIVSYGDIIYTKSNLLKLIESKEEVSLTIDTKWLDYWSERMENPLDDAESLRLDKNNNIIDIGNKVNKISKIEGQYMGLIKIRKDVIGKFFNHWQNMNKEIFYNGQNFDNMYMTSFLQDLINHNWKIKSIKVKRGWVEIDTPNDLKVAEAWLKKDPCKVLTSTFI